MSGIPLELEAEPRNSVDAECVVKDHEIYAGYQYLGSGAALCYAFMSFFCLTVLAKTL